MEHYYTAPENISADSLVISGDESKHIAKVLRKKQGNEIYITDGKGNLYKCVIESADKKNITCRILDKQKDVNEPGIKLKAYIALLKNPARFEFAVEKLTELGIYEIQPVITEYVINKATDKSERWQAIALSAMKQSQRCFMPMVYEPVNIIDAIKNCDSEVKLIAHEKKSGFRISNFEFESKRSAALFIGPEGGFTEEEIKLAEDNGCKTFSLGARKYRSETAAVAAAVLIFS